MPESNVDISASTDADPALSTAEPRRLQSRRASRPFRLIAVLALGTLLVLTAVTLCGWQRFRLLQHNNADRLVNQKLRQLQDDVTAFSRLLPRLERSILARMEMIDDDGLAHRTLTIWSTQTTVSRLQKSTKDLGMFDEETRTLAELLDQFKQMIVNNDGRKLSESERQARLGRLRQLEHHANETLERLGTGIEEQRRLVRRRLETRNRQRAGLAQFAITIVCGAGIIGLVVVLANRHQRSLWTRLETTDHQLSMVMTDLHSSREELLDRERKRLLGEVAESVAHELGNALVPICAMTDLLLQDRQLAAEHRHRCEVAKTACDDASRILSQLRAHMGSPACPSRPAILAVDQLLHQVVEFTRPKWEAESKQRQSTIDIQLDVEPELRVKAIDTELRQVFTNLLLNAVDAIVKQGHIVLRARHQRDRVVVDIIDDGVGVTDELSPTVGQGRYTTKAHGLGLGLRVCRELLGRCDGQLTILNVPSGGTCCTVSLPSSRQRVAAPEPLLISHTNFSDLRVLCVDDDASVLESLTALLSSLGVQVMTAAEGSSAIQQFKAQPADLVFCDMGLAQEDGVQVLKQLRELSGLAKLGLLTGWDESRLDPHEAWQPDFLLSKPATLAQLADILESVRPNRRESPG